MPGRASTGLLIALGVAAVLWLALQAAGWLPGPLRSDDARGSFQRDPLAEFEEELFAELARDPGLRGLPGLEHRVTGQGVLLGAVHLYVRGEGPRPLPGVEVRLIGQAANGQRHLAPVRTSDTGTFTMPEVPAGVGYVLIVDHAPYRRVVVRGLTVRPGRTTDAGTLVLGAPTSIVGEVVDARGRPLRGARVQVLRDTGRARSFDLRRALVELQASEAVLGEAAVDAQGRFVLEDMPPGRFVLRAEAPGHATTFKSGVLVTLDEHSTAVRIVLDPGAGFFGRVLDERGRGVGGARVIAVALPGRKLDRLDRVEVAADAAGAYRLDTLIPGMTYAIEAWAEGHAPTGSYTREIAGLKRRDFELKRTGRVEGRVTDEATGEPIAACTVLVLAGPLHGASPVSTTTDERGGFVLPHVNPGPILMFSAQAEGYQPGDRFNLAAVRGLRVAAGESTWVDWSLRAGGAVTGRVTASGAAVPYASLALVDRNRRRQRLTGEIVAVGDAQGAFRLVGVQPGDYDLRVSAPGHAPPTDPAQTHVRMPAELGEVVKDLELSRGGVLEGAVRSPDGDAVRGARVWVEAQDASTHADTLRDLMAITGGNGGFRLAGVPPGVALRVLAEHDAHVRSTGTSVELRPGQTRRLTLDLRRGATLPGRVVDRRGAPVAGARVRWGPVDGVRDRDLRESFSADEHLGPRVVRADDDGRFELTGLAPGKLLLKVEREGYASWYRRDLLIGADDRQPAITVELEATLTVRGRVTSSASGRALARAFVYARERGPGEGQVADSGRVQAVVSTETDANGRYVLDRLPPGTHEIVVWFAEGHIAAAQDRRNPKVRRKGVPAGARGIDFQLDPLEPPEDAPAPR